MITITVLMDELSLGTAQVEVTFFKVLVIILVLLVVLVDNLRPQLVTTPTQFHLTGGGQRTTIYRPTQLASSGTELHNHLQAQLDGREQNLVVIHESVARLLTSLTIPQKNNTTITILLHKIAYLASKLCAALETKINNRLNYLVFTSTPALLNCVLGGVA